jgi:hypothetical protein
MATPILLFGPVTADATAETVYTNLVNTVTTLESFTMAQPSTGVATIIRLSLGADGATTRVIEFQVPAGVGSYTLYPMLKITGSGTVLQLSSVSADDVVVCTASGRREAV